MKSSLVFIATIATALAADTTITKGPTTTSNPYATYPSVAKTASINGFADRIYDDLPACAQPCMHQDTRITPCPYWDTGCLCVMPHFGGRIGECVASACRGQDVLVATSLAVSICSSAGVWDPYWIIPPSVSSALSSAAAEVATTSATPTED